MKNPVIIKSYQSGLTIWLDNELDFTVLADQVAAKFQENAKFFGNMKVAISFEGRLLSGEEENQLVDIITKNSDLHIVCVVGKDDKKDKLFQETMAAFEKHFPKAADTHNEGQFYRGSLTGGQILETDGNVVILGNVEAGCCVISTKNIIVLGKLSGSAYAGGAEGTDSYIAALEMSPQKLKIGDFKYKNKDKDKDKGRWPFKDHTKVQPQIAYVEEEHIVLEPITDETLSYLSNN